MKAFCPKQLLLLVSLIFDALGFVLLFKFWRYVDLNSAFNGNVALGMYLSSVALLAVGLIVMFMAMLA